MITLVSSARLNRQTTFTLIYSFVNPHTRNTTATTNFFQMMTACILVEARNTRALDELRPPIGTIPIIYNKITANTTLFIFLVMSGCVAYLINFLHRTLPIDRNVVTVSQTIFHGWWWVTWELRFNLRQILSRSKLMNNRRWIVKLSIIFRLLLRKIERVAVVACLPIHVLQFVEVNIIHGLVMRLQLIVRPTNRLIHSLMSVLYFFA